MKYNIKNLPPNFVGYFGTMGSAGHNLYVLNGHKELSNMDVFDWAGEFDRDWIVALLSPSSFSVFYWKAADVTIVGYPRSLDDKRPGSKSLFILKGDFTQNHDFILYIMKKFPEVYKIFEKLADGIPNKASSK